MEEHKNGMKELLQSEGFNLKIMVTADELQAFEKLTHGKHKEGGPDVLTIAAPIVSVTRADGQDITGELKDITDKITDFGRSFKTTFAPGPEVGRLRCIIAGELTSIEGMDIGPEDWRDFADKLTMRNAALGIVIPEGKPQAIHALKPIRAGFFKAPGRLFDTPRHIAAQGKTDLLPEISRWYQQAAFNRTVGMAAAALTKMDTRDTILDWQSATIEEVADLIFCRSEEGTPSHGEHRERILKAFEALRAIPIPIVKIDWKQIGTDRNPRWIKEYKLRIASLLQSYGAVFVDKKTGKEVVAADPARKKDLVEAKPDRRKTMRKLVEMNPADGILKSFPTESYTLTRFEWRWNTDIAEDFICPQVALDKKDRPRLKLMKGRHIEGSRFIMLNRQYFAVQKHLRAAGSTYAPRLLDLIVSEKKHITSRGKGAVWIEIEAPKIIKWLDLWTEYQDRPKHVLEDHIAPAVMELIREKVMLPESWLVPQKDRNPERRKTDFFRWKVAELWTTVALVPSEEAKDIEDELVAQAEAKEAALSQPQPEADQSALPGIAEDAPSIPSGSDIRAAREAAGINLRDFARMMNGPSFKTWSLIETGQRSENAGRIAPEVWKRVWDFIAQHGKKGSEGEGKEA